jgi:hypothetical protein
MSLVGSRLKVVAKPSSTDGVNLVHEDDAWLRETLTNLSSSTLTLPQHKLGNGL